MAAGHEREGGAAGRATRRPTALLVAVLVLAEIAVWAAVRAAYPIGWPIDHMPVAFFSLENSTIVAFVIALPLLVGAVAFAGAPREGGVSRLVRALAAAAVFGAWLAFVTALRIDLISEPLWIALAAGAALSVLALGRRATMPVRV